MKNRKFRSMLDEMESLLPEKDKHVVIEARASHILESAINLLQLINDNFPPHEAQELQRRFFLAVKNENPKKFLVGIRRMKENKNDRNA